ncbi:MAG: hypothetical protein IKS54_08680 [Erysipelotrichaceae bacterium]|nr:hypothetical protein [Erysipelotrichaceae bacterium]
MKKIITVLMALLLVAGLSACTKKETEPEVKQPTAVPEELCGSYHEEIAGRASLEVREDYLIIDWSNSAYEKAHFEAQTDYDAENKRINYSNGVMGTVVYETEEKFTENELYNDGSGYFEVLEDRLIWRDDRAEENTDPVIFVRNEEISEEEEANMYNPWIYTTDLEEAIAFSGISFVPPIPEALPKDMRLLGYTANINGIISAEYESEGRVLTVRKSDTYSGQVLSGDYNEYSENWTEIIKGSVWDCYGDGESINLAYIDLENVHYSLNCRDINLEVSEGSGITVDELNSLVNGMQ